MTAMILILTGLMGIALGGIVTVVILTNFGQKRPIGTLRVISNTEPGEEPLMYMEFERMPRFRDGERVVMLVSTKDYIPSQN